MVQHTASIKRTTTAPDLLHLVRQRDRIGSVIPEEPRENVSNTRRDTYETMCDNMREG